MIIHRVEFSTLELKGNFVALSYFWQIADVEEIHDDFHVLISHYAPTMFEEKR